MAYKSPHTVDLPDKIMVTSVFVQYDEDVFQLDSCWPLAELVSLHRVLIDVSFNCHVNTQH